jgi:ATP-binding cassette subfamily C (CFTR/MRP) protein 1
VFGKLADMPLDFNSLVSNMVQGFIMFETSLGSLARLKDLADTLQPEDYMKEVYEPRPSWPERGHIELRNLSATHR